MSGWGQDTLDFTCRLRKMRVSSEVSYGDEAEEQFEQRGRGISSSVEAGAFRTKAGHSAAERGCVQGKR